MPAALDVRSLDAPIVQAGMGAVARHELAAAVSEAGGLGTIAGARAPIAAEIAAAHRLTGRPIAVNLLLPFVRSGDAEASAAADVIVTFWGTPRRLAANTWIHQCGSVEEATAAAAAGADAVIAQGVEAGGHVRGSTPMLELLERVRAAVKIPVLAAGGIIDAEGVRAALDGGAVAAVAGTRFLLSDESHAHPDYKQRCLDASETILTELFGLGWPGAPHRVIPNGATHRWLRGDPRGPQWIRAANRLTAPLASRIPPLCRTARSGPSVRLNPLPRATTAHRRRPGQPCGFRSALRWRERASRRRHTAGRRVGQSPHAVALKGLATGDAGASSSLRRPCGERTCSDRRAGMLTTPATSLPRGR